MVDHLDAFSFVNRSIKFTNSAIKPLWREAWSAKESALRSQFVKNVEHVNSSRNLSDLSIGDRVCIQNQCGPHPTKRDKSGTIVEKKDFHQYLVKVDGSGKFTMRNRKFLRHYSLPSGKQQNIPVILADESLGNAPIDYHAPPQSKDSADPIASSKIFNKILII